MSLSRLTLGKVALAWLVLLSTAALVLPNLDTHARAHPTVELVANIFGAALLIGTPIALIGYFNRQWRRAASVPNRAAYIVWLSLESIAAMGVLGLGAYTAVTLVVSRLR